MNRRGFLTGLAAALAAPAVVQAGVLMPVSVWRPTLYHHGTLAGLWDGYNLILMEGMLHPRPGGPVAYRPPPPRFDPLPENWALTGLRNRELLEEGLRGALPEGFRVSFSEVSRTELYRSERGITCAENARLRIEMVTESRRMPALPLSGPGRLYLPPDMVRVMPEAWQPPVLFPEDRWIS